MRRDPVLDADWVEPTRFGFDWGPVSVTRCATLAAKGGLSRVVQVQAGKRSLDIYVSPTGRSVRIFEDGKEWRRDG